ncbi:uncharacterized protein LOC120339404 [Styela clava]
MDEQYTFRRVIGQQMVPCVCKTDAIFEAVKLSTFAPQNLSKILSKEVLKFRIGKRTESEVQWEGLCSIHEVSINDILVWNQIKDCKTTKGTEKKIQQTIGACCNKHYWCYADYMYMKDLFQNHPEILPLLDWNSLGFHNKDGGDSTMWLGTTGAHTLCHYDTYGFNMVVQISGRKKWILFPPSDSDCLYPTRIPYEESSVFSEVNIKQPDFKKHPKFSSAHAHVVILNPGDMLYVPHHWWHYVENLELSVSINLWYEMENDATNRLQESITRLLVGSCSHVAPRTDFPWINPNESDSAVKSIDDGLQYLLQSLNEVSKSRKCNEHINDENNDSCPSDSIENAVTVIFPNRGNAITIRPLIPQNVIIALDINPSIRRKKSPVKKMKTLSMLNSRKNSSDFDVLSYTQFVKCLTHPEVIDAVSKVMLKQFSNTSNEVYNATNEAIASTALPNDELNTSNSNDDHVLIEIHEVEEEIQTTPLTDENNENLQYTILEGGSIRRGNKLYDSEGYSYSEGRKNSNGMYWRCVTRQTGRQSCNAAVTQYSNNRFVRNSRPHTHEPKLGVADHTRLMREARLFALENPSMSPREVAIHKLQEVSSSLSPYKLPSVETMRSYIARHRRHNSLGDPIKRKRKKHEILSE